MERKRKKWQKGDSLKLEERAAIERLIRDCPKGVSEIARDIGVSAKWIRNVVNQKIDAPFNAKKLKSLLNYFGYTLLDLAEGTVERNKRRSLSPTSASHAHSFGELVDKLLDDSSHLSIPLATVESITAQDILSQSAERLDILADHLQQNTRTLERLGRFDECLPACRLAAKIYIYGKSKHKDKIEGIFCQLDSLNVARLRGDESGELSTFCLLNEALDLIEKLSKDAASRILSDTGMVLYTHRFGDCGRSLFNEAKQILGKPTNDRSKIIYWTIERRIASLTGESDWQKGKERLDRVLAHFEDCDHRRGVANTHLSRLMNHAFWRKRTEWEKSLADHELDITIESEWNRAIFLCLRGLYQIATGHSPAGEPDLCDSLKRLRSLRGCPALGPDCNKWKLVCPDELLGLDHPKVRAYGLVRIPGCCPFLEQRKDFVEKVRNLSRG